MKIISYDVGIKSLAISFVEFNENLNKDIVKILLKFNLMPKKRKTPKRIFRTINKIKSILKNRIIIEELHVLDLIPGKKIKETDDIERTLGLINEMKLVDNYVRNVLNEKKYSLDDITVLIEYQMGPNDAARKIMAQLEYYHLSKGILNVHLVGGSLKLKVCFNDNMTYEEISKTVSRNYDANKKYSKLQMRYLLKYIDREDLVSHIEKKRHSDIADSFMMLVGWINKEYPIDF